MYAVHHVYLEVSDDISPMLDHEGITFRPNPRAAVGPLILVLPTYPSDRLAVVETLLSVLANIRADVMDKNAETLAHTMMVGGDTAD